jgi:hypothetical protein
VGDPRVSRDSYLIAMKANLCSRLARDLSENHSLRPFNAVKVVVDVYVRCDLS